LGLGMDKPCRIVFLFFFLNGCSVLPCIGLTSRLGWMDPLDQLIVVFDVFCT
jgi:hypothetical protein